MGEIVTWSQDLSESQDDADGAHYTNQAFKTDLTWIFLTLMDRWPGRFFGLDIPQQVFPVYALVADPSMAMTQSFFYHGFTCTTDATAGHPEHH